MGHLDGKSSASITEFISPEAIAAVRQLEASGCNLASIMDESGCFLYVSPEHEATFGWKNSEMVGHNIAEFVLPKDVPHLMLALQDGALNEQSAEVGLHVLAKDGSIMKIRGSGRHIGPFGEGRCYLVGQSVVIN